MDWDRDAFGHRDAVGSAAVAAWRMLLRAANLWFLAHNGIRRPGTECCGTSLCWCRWCELLAIVHKNKCKLARCRALQPLRDFGRTCSALMIVRPSLASSSLAPCSTTSMESSTSSRPASRPSSTPLSYPKGDAKLSISASRSSVTLDILMGR